MTEVAMTSRQKSPAAEEEATMPSVYDILFEMEDDVRTAVELSNGMVLMLSGASRSALEAKMEEAAMLRVAYILRKHAADVLSRWEDAFRATGGRA